MVQRKIRLSACDLNARVSGLVECVLRNLLTQLASVFDHLSGLLDGFLHPSIGEDIWQRPRHKAFLAGCLASGTAALAILPLHLALMGPTSLPMALMLAFMLGQLPLALYLSQTGNLERSHAISAVLFATFLAGMCLMTGGLSSFALIWLAVVPMEAALSGSRRIILATASLCAGILVGLSLLPDMSRAVAFETPTALLLSAIAACIYMSILSLRIALDFHRASKLGSGQHHRWLKFDDYARDIACRCRPDGSVTILEGPAERLLGLTARHAQGDWLLNRLQVADRLLYLATLATVRTELVPKTIDVRVRKGSAQPGEIGIAEHIWMSLELRPLDRDSDGVEVASAASEDLMLILKDIHEQKMQSEALADARTRVENERIASNRAFARASEEMVAPLENIVDLAELLSLPLPGHDTRDRQKEYAELIRRAGTRLQQVLHRMQETSQVAVTPADLAIEAVDLRACLGQSMDMMTPVASQAGIELKMNTDPGIGLVPADRRACMQILVDVLACVITSTPSGGHINVFLERDAESVLVETAGRGPGNSEEFDGTWDIVRSDALMTADVTSNWDGGLLIAKGLAELQGGELSLKRRPGAELSVRLRMPFEIKSVSTSETALPGRMFDRAIERLG